MGTIIAGVVVDRARRTLLELNVGETSATDVRWDRTRELLPHLNAGQRIICQHKPSANTVNASFQLATGATQTLPTAGKQLRYVKHNLGSGGSTVGRAITLIDRVTLTQIDPDWMTATGSAVQHFVFDQGNPKEFFVYPRPSGAWYVAIAYYGEPTEIAIGNIDSSAISVDDEWVNALHDFIVGYALLKNFKSGEPNKAALYLSRFEQAVGIELQRNMEFAPADQPAAAMAPDALGRI